MSLLLCSVEVYGPSWIPLYHRLAPPPILWCHVWCLRPPRSGVADCLLPPLERNTKDTVLDWRSSPPGHAGKGHVHRGVSKHQQLRQGDRGTHSGR